jgi:hypothetical protein
VSSLTEELASQTRVLRKQIDFLLGQNAAIFKKMQVEGTVPEDDEPVKVDLSVEGLVVNANVKFKDQSEKTSIQKT